MLKRIWNLFLKYTSRKHKIMCPPPGRVLILLPLENVTRGTSVRIN